VKGISGHRISREIRQRQVALGLCVGMTNRQMSEVLGISKGMVRRVREELLKKTGMDSFEFATQQNAAVREALWG
jgi:DNA-binding NarL/FixJ family response regulator